MPITREAIEAFHVVEDGRHDFKEQVDLDTDQGKAKFVDEVVAFLNVGHGHLILGVKESKGRFAGWRPMLIAGGDFDAFANKVQSIVKSCIDPMPLNVAVHPIEHDGGVAVDVAIGEHRMQPYQNKLTGGFRIRTDKQNQIISRDEIHAHFKRFDNYRDDLARLMREEAEGLAARGIMTEDGPVLTIGILPREHYGDHPRFAPRQGQVLKPGPLFPYSGYHSDAFKGCFGGVEAKDLRMDGKVNCRLFVSDDWFVHATIIHPFSRESDGRVGIYDMKPRLVSFLEGVAELLSEEGVMGPFAVLVEFSHLQRSEKVAWAFHGDGPVRFAPRHLLEVLDPQTLAEEAFQVVLRASRYG
jgi:hypothetical protein